MSRLKVKQISDFTTAVQTLIDNDVDQGASSIANNASSIGTNVTNISNNASSIAANASAITGLGDGGASLNIVQDASIDALQVLATAAASLNVVQDASIDALQVNHSNQQQQIDALQDSTVLQDDSIDALQAADVVIDASIDSLEILAAAAMNGSTYIKQGGLVSAADTFRILQAVKITSSDDLLVFVNGLEIHPVGIKINSGGEMGGAQAATSEGYTVTGTTFTVANLGYDLEGDDHVHVVGVKA